MVDLYNNYVMIMMINIIMIIQINKKNRMLIHHLLYQEIPKDLIVNIKQKRMKIIKINKSLNAFYKIIMRKRICKKCWTSKVMMNMIIILEMPQIKKMIK